MTPSMKQAEEFVADADHSARTARQRIGDLINRLRGGDTTVTAEELAAAKAEADRAALLAEHSPAVLLAAEAAEFTAKAERAVSQLADADAAWSAALAEHAGPAVEHLAALLAAAHERNTAHESVKAGIARTTSFRVDVPAGVSRTEVPYDDNGNRVHSPEEVRYRYTLVTDPLKSADLFTEVVAGAFRRAGLVERGTAVKRINPHGDGDLGSLAKSAVSRTSYQQPKYLPSALVAGDAG